MNSQKTILVGIDFSPSSACALREASRIANAEKLPLICFHVLDKEVLKQFIAQDNLHDVEVLDLASAKLNTFIQDTIGTAHQIETIVKIGNSFALTLDLIEENKVKTLVLGSQGLTSFEGLEIGTLAARCVRKAPVEVLLVRSCQGEPFKSIGVCVDFSETSIQAAHRAAEIAFQDGAALKLIHAYRDPAHSKTDIGWLKLVIPMKDHGEIREDLQKQLQELGQTISEKYHLKVTTEVKCSHSISGVLYKTLKEMEADLVVFGTRGLTGIKKLLIGSTAENLIHTTPCSALIIKPKGFTFSLN